MLLNERTEMAIVINFGKYPVIPVDMDNYPYEEDRSFLKGPIKVRVAWDHKNPRYEGMTTKCTLYVEKGEYKLGYHGSILKGSYGMEDFLADIEEANTPLVHRDDIVAVPHYSKELGVKMVRMMKVSHHIDTNCQVVATLSDVSDEEAKEIKRFITNKKRF